MSSQTHRTGPHHSQMSFRVVRLTTRTKHSTLVLWLLEQREKCEELRRAHNSLKSSFLLYTEEAREGPLTCRRNSWVVLDHGWSHWNLLCDSVSMLELSGECLLVMAIWLVVVELSWRKWSFPFQQLTEATCVWEQLCFSVEPWRCIDSLFPKSQLFPTGAVLLGVMSCPDLSSWHLEERWCSGAKRYERSRRRGLAWTEC